MQLWGGQARRTNTRAYNLSQLLPSSNACWPVTSTLLTCCRHITTPLLLQGGWNLTESVYDYSAKLPMAQVLSWERPRLVRRSHHLAAGIPVPGLLVHQG